MAVKSNPNKGKAKSVVWGVKATSKIVYAWKGKSDPAEGITGISDTEVIEQLGLINITESGVPSGFVAIMGANAPKPPRLTKTGTDGKSISMFCASDKYPSALRLGWSNASRGRIRGTGDSASQIVVTVEIYSLHYCWNAYQDILSVGKTGGSGTGLADFCGIKDASEVLTTDTELSLVVFGTSRPRPAEALFTMTGGTGSSKKPNLRFFVSEEQEKTADDLRRYCKSLIPSVPPIG
jgi:hypothetical protein